MSRRHFFTIEIRDEQRKLPKFNYPDFAFHPDADFQARAEELRGETGKLTSFTDGQPDYAYPISDESLRWRMLLIYTQYKRIVRPGYFVTVHYYAAAYDGGMYHDVARVDDAGVFVKFT